MYINTFPPLGIFLNKQFEAKNDSRNFRFTGMF